MMKKLQILLLSLLIAHFASADLIETEEATIDSTELYTLIYKNYSDSVNATFQYSYDKIELNNGIASIEVPEGFKYLDAKQSQYVLTELWGNPPGESLGMLFPISSNPVSNLSGIPEYAVEITYSEEGYIEDEDAESIDYDELLETMRNDFVEANAERVKQGYEEVQLIGWASAPYYDKNSKKLHWAKELKFGESTESTLNYNIRILGRNGYLNMNAIGDMNVLPQVKNDINKILASVNFNEGNTYADFDPDIDEVAAYGIGGLVAGKILAKVGFFAVIAKFWKLIAVGAVAAFAGLKKFIFGAKKEE